MGADLPEDIEVVGVVIERGDVFGEELTESVATAVPVAAEMVVGVLHEHRAGPPGRDGASHA
jgi:hypothetical protein